jgi:hypothetical protein
MNTRLGGDSLKKLSGDYRTAILKNFPKLAVRLQSCRRIGI